MCPYRLAFRALAICLVLPLLYFSDAEASDNRPNILLVVADDLGWTDLGCFGSEIDTPHLDALAQRGVKFTSFYTSVSCSPTRSMLLSGTDNHLAGLGNMVEFLTPQQRGRPGYEGYLNNRVVSLGEVLRDGGYHTYMAGKWHLGHESNQLPHARGFERSFSLLGGGGSYWADRSGLSVRQKLVTYAVDDKILDELPGDFYATRGYTDFLIDAIRKNLDDGKPFLAYLAFTTPHDPLHVPEPWLSRYHGEYDDGYEVLKRRRAEGTKRLELVPNDAPLPRRHQMVKAWDTLSKEEQAIASRGMEVYAGMVSNMDYHYGRIEAFLRDIGEYDNTIVIFISDNGPNPYNSEDYPGNRDSEWLSSFDNSLGNLGSPGSNYAYGIGFASASAGPLDLFKMTVGEGGIRAPMLIDCPGIKGGRQIGVLTYVWDIMPTILDFAGISHRDEYRGRRVERMRGRSLRGALTGTKKTVYDPEEYICGGEMGGLGAWIRHGDF